MPELRISDVPAAGGRGRRVEVTWQDGPARRTAVAEFDGTGDDRDGELIRWYLEDYAEAPADPAPALAASAEKVLACEGTELFRRVFGGPDAAGIWERARDRLADARVEVDADPGDGPGLAWELLRDPARDAPVALGAGAFVRVHPRAAGHPVLPEPSGDRLRVLLVICRPGGRADVPFRSVASRLVRGGADQMAGLDLDVLRPATFTRLSAVLRAAKAAGRPYHVVHFDGHGDYLDVAGLTGDPDDPGQVTGTGGAGGSGLSPLRYGVSVAGPVRPGQHGYLLFEAPGGSPSGRAGTGPLENTQLVDGPTLGRLLTETGVPVLLLNACRSAYAEARSRPDADSPGPDDGQPVGPSPGVRPPSAAVPARSDEPAGDVHARIRAYGSLAAEVADAGVPGVVAMRYSVYVVTAAQFVADLYAHLLAGQSLGEAATEARRALAADPTRRIGAEPVALQDWAVPLIYESAPLAPLRPATHAAPVIRLTPGDGPSSPDADAASDGLPRPPDAGFFGRDETLLALDRAFDTQRIVLLHAFAGAGKSSTAAEFARWYEGTGGLDHPGHPERGHGPVLWSSFEHHLTADRVIGQAGDHFAPLIDQAYGKAWAAITDPAERRDVVLQVLAQIPVLWVWDNVEPVAGFPAGAPSAWTNAEQAELVDLLRDLSLRTQCKMLLTSRRDEHAWLGDLPARVRLPAMPMRESLQLAAALAARRGESIATADWRPLLRFAAGNPLTITVVTGQALREGLAATDQIAAFVARLRAGEAAPESTEDATLGRTRSLAASLDYGFTHAFKETERAQLALLHLFRDAVYVGAFRAMGDPEISGEDMVPELAGLDPGTGIALLGRAADIGLLSSLSPGYYRIHPALPWYFAAQFTAAYGQNGDSAARRATRAYAAAIGLLGDSYHSSAEDGELTPVFETLRAEEGNLLHGYYISRAEELWATMVSCMRGLSVLYDTTGRDGEWARLVADATAVVTDITTGEALPGAEGAWVGVTTYRVRLAKRARDWPTAASIQERLLAWDREHFAAALSAPADTLTPSQRNAVRDYGIDLGQYGDILKEQDDPACLPYMKESLALAQKIGDRQWEAQCAGNLGNAYSSVPRLKDLDQAERWYRHSLSLRAESDQLGRARNLSSLAAIAVRRFDAAREARAPKSELLKHLNEALRGYSESLELTPSDDHASRGLREAAIGVIYARAGDVGQALRHYQRAINHHETRGDLYGAGHTRYNIGLLLRGDNRFSDALNYARAALDNFRSVGPGAAGEAAAAAKLIAYLEQRVT